MKLEQLIHNAEAKKATINFDYKDQIGIRFQNQNTWHWFDIFRFNQFTEIEFNHSYSMNTGRISKSFRHEMKVKKSLGFY